MMARLTPAKREQFLDELCKATGVTRISKATAAAIEDVCTRSEHGLPVSEDEISATC